MVEYEINKDKLLQKGAEASLFKGCWFGKEVIFKQRLSKKYRLPQLDDDIRSKRTLNEARALIRLKQYGINVPLVHEIDVRNHTIIMQFIDGIKLKKVLPQLEDDEKLKYFKQLGKFIALLHQNGHVHGDITTSNVIITPEGELFLIDFGLHDYSDSIEDKSVDLHLLKRVLISSHGADFNTCFTAFTQGYRIQYQDFDPSVAEQIIKNISVIETRGRYVKKDERL